MTDALSRPVRADFAVFRTIPTRWSDNDVYGHVNNVVYYAWFDTAVNAALIERGLLETAGEAPIFVVAETRCRFFASLSFPEPAEVGIAVERMGTSSVVYRLGVFPAGGDAAAAAGRFVHVCVDRESRQPRPVPAVVRDRLVAEFSVAPA